MAYVQVVCKNTHTHAHAHTHTHTHTHKTHTHVDDLNLTQLVNSHNSRRQMQDLKPVLVSSAISLNSDLLFYDNYNDPAILAIKKKCADVHNRKVIKVLGESKEALAMFKVALRVRRNCFHFGTMF
jgi:hypothetical protein